MITLRQEEEWMEFLDPTQQWKPLARKTEVRFDPLTGETSRILYYPMGELQPPDYTTLAEQTSGVRCPFCEENVTKVTPRFPAAWGPERFRRGEALLFPNMFPYAKHSGVGIFSSQHYVPLKEFQAKIIRDGFLTALDYVKTIARLDPLSQYASINWNYMPLAGGSIIHPHLQIVASPSPTNYQQRTLDAAKAFWEQHRHYFFERLVMEERTCGERYIAKVGNVEWLTSFAPQGLLDMMAVFSGVRKVQELGEEYLESFSRGLSCLMRYMQDQGFVSFNLALFLPLNLFEGYSVHARIIPRATLGPLGTSDVNYFKVLHNEALSLKSPEETTKELKRYFAE